MNITETWLSEQEKKIRNQLLPCPHCGGDGVLEKKGNTISYWQVRCFMCRSLSKGTTMAMAIMEWNNRPSSMWTPLAESSYLLPSGQKYQHVIIHEDGNISLIDYMDGEIVAQVDVNLGQFRIGVKR